MLLNGQHQHRQGAASLGRKQPAVYKFCNHRNAIWRPVKKCTRWPGAKYVGKQLHRDPWTRAGVHNLHGIPGIMGGLLQAIVLLVNSLQTAALAQLAALGATVAVALAGGALCALIVCAIPNLPGEELVDAVYDDSVMLRLEDDDAEISWQHSNAKLGAEQVHGGHAEKV